MSNQKPKLLLIGLTIAGWSMIFDTLLPKSSALGATLNFNVSVNGKTLGNITLDEALGSNGGRGLEGGFTPTGMTGQ
ncbi:hypothetical protein [Phormidium nigroviride]